MRYPLPAGGEAAEAERLLACLTAVAALDAAVAAVAALPARAKVPALLPQAFLSSAAAFLDPDVRAMAAFLLRRWCAQSEGEGPSAAAAAAATPPRGSPERNATGGDAGEGPGEGGGWFRPAEAAELAERFCQASFGDAVFGQAVMLCLRNAEAPATARAAWQALQVRRGTGPGTETARKAHHHRPYGGLTDPPGYFSFLRRTTTPSTCCRRSTSACWRPGTTRCATAAWPRSSATRCGPGSCAGRSGRGRPRFSSRPSSPPARAEAMPGAAGMPPSRHGVKVVRRSRFYGTLAANPEVRNMGVQERRATL